jgi:hypothetical protein
MKLRNWSNCLIPWILLFVFKGQDCNIQERGHGRYTPNMLWCSLTTYCQPIFSLHYMIDDLSRQLSWVSRFQFALLESGWVQLKTAEPLIPYFVRVLFLMVKWVCETWRWQWLGQVRFIPSSSTPSSFGSSDRFFMALFLLMIFIYLFFKFNFNI